MKKSIALPFLFICFFSFAQDETNEIKNVANKRSLAEYEILVTPNPSHGDIKINAPNGSTCILSSAKGTYIGTWKIMDNGFTLESMSSGSYIAVIDFEGQVITRRFIVL